MSVKLFHGAYIELLYAKIHVDGDDCLVGRMKVKVASNGFINENVNDYGGVFLEPKSREIDIDREVQLIVKQMKEDLCKIYLFKKKDVEALFKVDVQLPSKN